MITILVGTSLSGKSTWAKCQNRYIISSDSERESLFGTYRMGNPYEENLIQRMMEAKLRLLNDVIIDNTNLKIEYIDNFIKVIKELGLEYNIVIFPLLDIEILIKRNQKRFLETGKLIPEKVLFNQIKNYKEVLINLEKNNINDKIQEYLPEFE